VGRNPIARIQHFLRIAGTPHMTRDIIQARCERGAQIAGSLGFSSATSEAIAHVDEHWCGLGHPVGLAGDEIPILSRVLLLSQTVEAFFTENGVDAAIRMAKSRRARWFDPTLVDIVAGWRRDRAWWASIANLDTLDAQVVSQEPGSMPEPATHERLDAISGAFASVIDAKTPYTFSHSWNVAHYATAIGSAVGVDVTARRELLRAGLLHDIGKLGVSNRILDKPSGLTEAERDEVRKHPVWTWQILERVPAFREFAEGSARHHERMDGTGYPWGISAEGLDLNARILAVADVYEALTADRPYRAGMGIERTLGIMMKERGTAFDIGVLDATATLAEQGVFAGIAAGDWSATQHVPETNVRSILTARSAA
jgi:putative nucleotidyltransferase with HDIG domain